MAHQEQVELLRSGVFDWNAWRKENPGVAVDLSGADLTEADLFGASLTGATLSGAHLSGADLNRAHLTEANLFGASLTGADLTETNLYGADLRGADLTDAVLYETVFANVDLSQTKGLEACGHDGPSTIDGRTLKRSGTIPQTFPRGCGLSDWEIEAAKLHTPGLSNAAINDIVYRIFELRATQAVQISPLFISYSHADRTFVDALGELLTERGIRYWRDIHHATSGKLEKIVDRAMRLNPTVLIVLSEQATTSDWVEHEVKKARQLEKATGRDCLCPIALDESWKTCRWPERLKEQIIEYHILDFSAWEDRHVLNTQFDKLVQGLGIFYQ